MGKYLVFLILIGCTNDNDMKLFINNLPSNKNFLTDQENIIFIGTSNCVNRNTMIEMTTAFPDLPTDGFIDGAFYNDDSDTMKPYTLLMNQTTDHSGDYGYEYRIAKLLLENNTNQFNLLKVSQGGSRMADGGNWAVGGVLPEIVIQRANLSTGVIWNKVFVVGWENDCTTQEYAEEIQVNFEGLITELRDRINPDLEFYYVEMGPFTSGSVPFTDIGRAQMQLVADNDSGVSVFNPTWIVPDADNFRDGLHYNPAASDIIARKFVETFY